MSSLQNSLPEMTQGKITLSQGDEGTALALGLINGTEPEVKFGHVINAAAVATDVWSNGVAQPLYIFPDVAGEGVTIKSTAIGDDQTMIVFGLDVAGLIQTTSVVLDGTTPVVVPGIWTAINRVENNDISEFTGVVTVQGDGGTSTNVFAHLLASDQKTTQAVYTVPSNKVAIINNYSTAINRIGGTTVDVEFRLYIAKPGKVFLSQIVYGLITDATSNISSDLIVPIPVAPGARIKVRGLPSAINTGISGEFSMKLVDTSLIPAAILASLL